MAHKNKEPEPDKTERIQKHKRREDGKKHNLKQTVKGHASLKPNERDHNYNYLKHLEDYEEDWEDETD